jgi:hypothetical protein
VCCAAAATELVLNADGSASISKDLQRYPGTWTRDANALTFTLTTPVVRSEFVDGGIEVQTKTKQFIVRQLTGNADRGFVMITQAGDIHYPGGQRQDGSFASNTSSAFSEWSRLSAPADVSGSTLAGIPDQINPQAIGIRQLILAMAADGTATSPQLPLVSSTWALQGGKLVLNFPGGRTQTLARLAVAANGEERWLSRAGTAADYAPVEFTVARAQSGLAFTDANAVSRWRARPALSEISIGIYINLLANHTGTEQAEDLSGAVTTVRNNGWTIENGALVITSYQLPDGSVAGSCPAGVTCTIRAQRTWTMVRSDATGVFVFEKARFSDTDIRYRVFRYDRS